MSRLKTFFIYFLIFVGFYVISNLLINAYIKTSYYKITNYEINVNDATITIMNAKASKDDGYIEGKISNAKDESIKDKYMVVELFSENNVCLGTEYVKIERIRSGEIKDFKVTFGYNNVKSFKISLISEEQKQELENQKQKSIFNFKSNEKVDTIVNAIDPTKNKEQNKNN